MSNELSIQRQELTPAIWSMINSMAPVMYESRMFGVSSPAAAAAIMLKGHDLGLSMTAAFEFIQVIQGKPGLSPRGALAILHASPEITKLEIKRLADQAGKFVGYECTMARKNGFSFTGRFTMEDAQKASLIKSGSGWANYPENMCMWRAVGFAADVVAPDITAGMTAVMKMPEALGVTLSQEGDVIDGTFTQNAPTAVVESPVTRQTITLDSLVDQFGAEAVMVANGGQIPMSDEQVAACAEKLSKDGAQ